MRAERRTHIKFLVMDVDGTLTDGKIYMGANGELMKAFNIKDGCGICKILPTLSIVPVIITARESKILEQRCKELGITECHQACNSKIEMLDNIIRKYSAMDGQKYGYDTCAYIGDDIVDLQCMETIKRAHGLVGCPADGIKQIRDIADFVSRYNGGEGAVREFIEWIADTQGKYDVER